VFSFSKTGGIHVSIALAKTNFHKSVVNQITEKEVEGDYKVKVICRVKPWVESITKNKHAQGGDSLVQA
jgi:hypothetical protein